MTLADLDAQAAEIVRRYEYPKAAMLPLLWLVQQNMVYISTDARPSGRMLGSLSPMCGGGLYIHVPTLLTGRRDFASARLPCVLRGRMRSSRLKRSCRSR